MTSDPGTLAAAFGAHRRPHLHLHRPHVELCSKKTALTLLCFGLAALATIATNRTDHLLAVRPPSPALIHGALTSGFARGFAVGAGLAIIAALTAPLALRGGPSQPLSPDPRPAELAI